MDQTPSSSLFSAEGERVKLSRLLLVALVMKEEMSISEIGERLREVVGGIRKTHPEFVFDLGWGENLRTAYQALANLSWVTQQGSRRAFQATPVGLSHLEDHAAELNGFLKEGLGAEIPGSD